MGYSKKHFCRRLFPSFLSLGFLVIFTGPLFAETLKKYDGGEIFRNYKEAVAKIILKVQGVPASSGTGFFVSDGGELITNFHVYRTALKSGGFSIEFQLYGGKIVRAHKILGCSDSRRIDLCLLKLPVKPKKWFQKEDVDPQQGESLYVIGHPKGLDFSITDGIVSGFRTYEDVEHVQVSAPISGGNSGGPIIDQYSRLLGVATWTLAGGFSQNLNFGISAEEVWDFHWKQKRKWKGIGYAAFKHKYNERKKKLAQDIKKDVTDPALERINKGKRLEDDHFSPMTIQFAGQKYKLQRYSPFEQCTSSNSGYTFDCFTQDKRQLFQLNFFEEKSGYLKDRGKKKRTPSPLAFVQSMIASGTWDEKKKSLNKTQIKYLHTIPQGFKCQEYSKSRV
jgi:hypothetical protein